MPYPKSQVDVEAKHGFMTAFFDDACERVEFLTELHDSGRDTEAFTLCLTYVDSFAQWLFWPRRESGRNFVDSLAAHEASRYLALIHPLQAVRSFKSMNGFWQTIASRIEAVFPGPQYDLLDHSTFSTRLAGACSGTELKQVHSEIWRGTMGAVAYYWLRNPSVHRFGSTTSLGFSGTSHNGVPAPMMNLQTFLPPLRAMIEEARKRSAATCQWFGDDRIVLDA